jgi:hypothetical protein
MRLVLYYYLNFCQIMNSAWHCKYIDTLKKININYKNIPKIDNQKKINKLFQTTADPVWAALISLQDTQNEFDFISWKKYVNCVVDKILGKSPNDINDLPYYDLWVKNSNPLFVAFYAIFNSGEDLDKTILSEEEILWIDSPYYLNIRSKIDYIIAHL